MPYFTIFQDNLPSVNMQDDQSWALTKTVQNISKIRPSVSHLTSAKFEGNINRITPQHNKEFMTFIFFLFKGFITMCTLKKRLIRAAF